MNKKRSEKKHEQFTTEFNRIKASIEKGKTPVYSELRSTKTSLIELVPSLAIQSILLVISTIIISHLKIGELTRLVVLLVINTTTQTLSFAILTILKHGWRVHVLKKHGIPVTEENIAVLESREYQSV